MGTVKLNCLTTLSGGSASAKLLMSGSGADRFSTENDRISVNLTVPSKDNVLVVLPNRVARSQQIFSFLQFP